MSEKDSIEKPDMLQGLNRLEELKKAKGQELPGALKGLKKYQEEIADAEIKPDKAENALGMLAAMKRGKEQTNAEAVPGLAKKKESEEDPETTLIHQLKQQYAKLQVKKLFEKSLATPEGKAFNKAGRGVWRESEEERETRKKQEEEAKEKWWATAKYKAYAEASRKSEEILRSDPRIVRTAKEAADTQGGKIYFKFLEEHPGSKWDEYKELFEEYGKTPEYEEYIKTSRAVIEEYDQYRDKIGENQSVADLPERGIKAPDEPDIKTESLEVGLEPGERALLSSSEQILIEDYYARVVKYVLDEISASAGPEETERQIDEFWRNDIKRIFTDEETPEMKIGDKAILAAVKSIKEKFAIKF